MKEKMILFLKIVFENSQNRQMNWLKMCRKNPFPTDYAFFFESSESYRVFNYLHDSNSISWAAGMNTDIYCRRAQ